MKANTTTASETMANPGLAVGPMILRAALLIVPEVLAVKAFGHNPIFCLILCLGILWVWLSVDVGPFSVQDGSAKVAGPSLFQNFRKAQWWNGMFFRVFLLVAIFHSKLTI